MKPRVFVVEDDPLSCELLCDWLETEGYQVVSATNLEEAFRLFRGEPPNVVLLDVQLGADDGLALASWIRQEPALRHVPVIAVTAHAMVTEQQRVLVAGCNVCVSKPVDFEALRGQLRRWLGAPEST